MKGNFMKKILLILVGSFCICQIPIETKEYRIYKDRDVNEINILDLIKESNGLFKVEFININQPKYDKAKKSLIVVCELEFDISSDYSKNSIEYKICKNKVQSGRYLIINEDSPTIKLNHNYKYLEGEVVLRISGEYKDTKNSSNRSDNGILREWYDNGQLYLEFSMKNGIKNGVCKKWYDDGQLQMIYNYTMGQLNGSQRKWFSDGNLRAEWNYLNDELHGISTEWNNDGSIKSRKQFKNGKLVKKI